MLFHKIEGAQCVLSANGVFKQTDVYQRNGEIFARSSGGFIALKDSRSTSHPKIFWDHIEGVRYVTRGNFGRLVIGTEASPPLRAIA